MIFCFGRVADEGWDGGGDWGDGIGEGVDFVDVDAWGFVLCDHSFLLVRMMNMQSEVLDPSSNLVMINYPVSNLRNAVLSKYAIS